jgi:hypothetical protein
MDGQVSALIPFPRARDLALNIVHALNRAWPDCRHKALEIIPEIAEMFDKEPNPWQIIDPAGNPIVVEGPMGFTGSVYAGGLELRQNLIDWESFLRDREARWLLWSIGATIAKTVSSDTLYYIPVGDSVIGNVLAILEDGVPFVDALAWLFEQAGPGTPVRDGLIRSETGGRPDYLVEEIDLSAD